MLSSIYKALGFAPEFLAALNKMTEEAEAEQNEVLLNKPEQQPVDRDQKTRVHFDDVLKEVGEFGPYQRKIYFILFLPTIFSAMHKLAWVFLGAKVNHRCRLEGEPDNTTYDSWEGAIQSRTISSSDDRDLCLYLELNSLLLLLSQAFKI